MAESGLFSPTGIGMLIGFVILALIQKWWRSRK